MGNSRQYLAQVSVAVGALAMSLPALANPQVLERARQLLRENNPKQAFVELVAVQSTMTGDLEFDYLLGVAALDSGKFDDAIIAFERVLATNPGHAGAQMDMGRAYFALGSFDLAAAAFKKLRESNPPPQALQAINQYLEAIDARQRETRAGWSGFAEASLGFDTNLTGVPGDFGAASQQSFAIAVDPTGNSVKRDAGYFEAQAALEYTHPITRGWTVFGGGSARGRAYHKEDDFNIIAGELHGGASLNDGPHQWRVSAGYQDYTQDGAAPGEPKPTNDRNTATALVDWRFSSDTRTQFGANVQFSQVRFPDNQIDDFDQIFLGASWMRSFEGKGVPLIYLSGFVTDDKAKNTFSDGVTTKSKNLGGVRAYYQQGLAAKVQGFSTLGFVYRKDKDPFARSTTVESGRDKFYEAAVGLTWQFRERCAVRAQVAYTRNESNIDIYDFDRTEASTAVRCDLF